MEPVCQQLFWEMLLISWTVSPVQQCRNTSVTIDVNTQDIFKTRFSFFFHLRLRSYDSDHVEGLLPAKLYLVTLLNSE